jgi:hypothetical protein
MKQDKKKPKKVATANQKEKGAKDESKHNSLGQNSGKKDGKSGKK